MANNIYNPDVLNCIANLSNDEVFTPPELANKMLDLLPQELFCSPKTTFLDPFTKSGVFLREIVKRLDRGLEKQMPDRQQRIDHILHHQVFGIACTELTSLLSRRSVYCSKFANGKYSISKFNTEEGNILYRNLKHTWVNGKCKYCGASQSVYDRGSEAEQYAYMFIHTDNPNKFFNNMKFDVIVGNPPYQLSDGSGGSSDAAMPLYNAFVEQSYHLSNKYLLMIIPSKWMVGGRGLQSFRRFMIDNKDIHKLVDFENASECFSGIHIDGGVCYFLMEKNYKGLIEYSFKANDGTTTTSLRKLENDYFDFVIRDQRIISIIDKCKEKESFAEIVSSTKPFGIRGSLFNEPSRYADLNLKENKYQGSVKIFGVKGIKGGARRQIGYVLKNAIKTNKNHIDKFKLFFTTSFSTNAINYPDVIIAQPGDICTETFLEIGPFISKEEQMNCLSYMQTDLFKILLYYGKGTVRVYKEVFKLIPLQDFSHPWTDEMLYKKYGLTDEEIAFIESMIRPME